MASLNKVILIGNLTADPELKQTQNGISVTSFSIAVQRRYVSKNAPEGSQPQTADFINIVAWRQSAEFITRYFKKGRPICVCGSLQTRNWTDTSNVKHYITEVVADEVSFVDSKPDAERSNSQNTTNNTQYVPESYGAPTFNNAGSTAPKFEEISGDDDSLPF